jgi:uncharacterized protein
MTPAAQEQRGAPSVLPVLAGTLASVAWLLAFSLGARAGHLYGVLGTLAALLVVWTLARSAELRAALRPKATHVVAGLALGVITLVLTHAAFPLVARLVPGVMDEVARLYGVAQITPAALAGVALIIVAEEVLWRGALPRALEAHVSRHAAALLATASYTAAQLGAGSWLLGLAALGLGALWMLCARLSGALVMPLLCHAVWTLGVLGFWPLAVAR